MKKSLGVLIMLSCFFFSSFIVTLANPVAPKKTPELLAQGKKLFEQNCSPCHGPNGDGKGPVGAALKPSPNDFTKPLKDWPTTKGDPNKIFEVISKGIPNSGMLKWDQLPEQDRWALTYRVIDFAPAPKTPTKKK